MSAPLLSTVRQPVARSSKCMDLLMYVCYGTSIVTLWIVPPSLIDGGPARGKDTVWSFPWQGRFGRGVTRSRSCTGPGPMAPALP